MAGFLVTGNMMDGSQLIGDRYELGGLLGQGGMGSVYRAIDRLTGDEIALKQVAVSAQQLQFATLGHDTEDAKLALADEFRTLAGLRHPFIVGVIDYGFDTDGQPYFTMQLVENSRPITDYARGRSRSQQIGMIIDMLQALVYLHRRGIVHRDLKPGNVLVNQDGLVQVMDFGLAISQAQSDHGGIAGTLGYMAPEILQEQPATPQSDIFAAGIMIYEILTGNHPFDASSPTTLIYSILNGQPDLTAIDTEFAAVIGRMLAHDPALRYATVDEIITALCDLFDLPLPRETAAIRDSFLSASRFVGREQELGILLTALRQAAKRQGSAYLVSGESGVGKSRLLDELRTHALVEGALVVRGQAVDGGGTPYQIWRDILPRLLLSISISATEAAILAEVVPDIHRFINTAPADVPQLPGSAGHQRLALTIASLFERQSRPIVLLLEDLQWARESLEPLRHILAGVHQQPLLVIGNYRLEEAPDLPQQLPEASVITLPRLDSQHIESLSASMLGSAGTQAEVVELLKKETEGNVFFLVEVVRALAEEAGRLTDVGRFTLPERVFAGGVRQVIRRRLDHIPDWGQRLLKLAAIAGRQIEPDLLVQLAVHENIVDWLAICGDAAVLEVTDNNWRFSHDKLRESILSDLQASEKPDLFRQVAQGIEILYPDAPEQSERLTHLWREAGDHQKEWHYGRIAADTALKLGNYRVAIEHARRALSLYPEITGDNDLRREADLYYLIGEASENLGHMEEAHHAYGTAQTHYERINDEANIAKTLAALGNLDTTQNNFERAIARIDASLEIRRRIQDQTGIALSLLNRGVVEVKMNRYDTAEKLWQESRDILLGQDNPHELVKTYNNLGILCDLTERQEEARRHYEHAIAIREQLNDRAGLASTLGNLGAMLATTGQYEEAREYLTRAMHLYRSLHFKRGLAFGLSQMAYIARLHDKDHVLALKLLHEALPLSEELGARDDVCNHYRDIAANELALGNIPEAAQALAAGMRIATELDYDHLKYQLAYWYARLRLEQQRPAEGLAVLLCIQPDASEQMNIDAQLKEYRLRYPAAIVQEAESLSSKMTLADITRAILNTDTDSA